MFLVSDFCQFMIACDKSPNVPGGWPRLHHSVSCTSLRPDFHGCMLQWHPVSDWEQIIWGLYVHHSGVLKTPTGGLFILSLPPAVPACPAHIYMDTLIHSITHIPMEDSTLHPALVGGRYGMSWRLRYDPAFEKFTSRGKCLVHS